MRTQEVRTQTPEAAPYSLGQLVRYFLSLGTLGFGGSSRIGRGDYWGGRGAGSAGTH